METNSECNSDSRSNQKEYQDQDDADNIYDDETQEDQPPLNKNVFIFFLIIFYLFVDIKMSLKIKLEGNKCK